MTARLEINPRGLVYVGLGVRGLRGLPGAGEDGLDGVAAATAPLTYDGGTHTIAIADGSGAGQTIRWNGTAWVAAPIAFADLSGSVADGQLPVSAVNQHVGSLTAPVRVYNGPVDATNYERAFFRWTSDELEIGAEKSGTGTQCILRFQLDGAGNVIEGVSGQNLIRVRCGGSVSMGIGVGIWSFSQWRNGSGTRIIGTDAGGGNPNRDADPVTVAAGLGTGNGAAGHVASEAAPSGSSGTALHVLEPVRFDYVLTAGQPMMSLGGKTSAFPALKRSSAVMQARLADDSGFAAIQGKLTAHAAAATETIVPTKTLRLFDSDGVEYKVAVVPV